MEANFLFSRNNILLFRAFLKFLKFGGSRFFKRVFIPARGNWFSVKGKLILFIFRILLLVKAIFCLVETYFSFPMVETDFLPCENHFLLFNLFLQVEAIIEVNDLFFGKYFILASKKGFSVQWKLFSFIPCFFPASGNH